MVVSIHALRVESDLIFALLALGLFVSIHALRVESDMQRRDAAAADVCFNPRSPCGERP